MKITKQYLKQMIKEELEKALHEGPFDELGKRAGRAWDELEKEMGDDEPPAPVPKPAVKPKTAVKPKPGVPKPGVPKPGSPEVPRKGQEQQKQKVELPDKFLKLFGIEKDMLYDMSPLWRPRKNSRPNDLKANLTRSAQLFKALKNAAAKYKKIEDFPLGRKISSGSEVRLGRWTGVMGDPKAPEEVKAHFNTWGPGGQKYWPPRAQQIGINDPKAAPVYNKLLSRLLYKLAAVKARGQGQ